MEEISKRIKQYRTELGYSLKKLEELTGISSSTLQRYETRSNAKIPTTKITALADALGVTPTCLIGWESKELRYDEYSNITSLLDGTNHKIKYDGIRDTFELFKNDEKKCTLNPQQIKSLNDKITSYFIFELENIIRKEQPNKSESS